MDEDDAEQAAEPAIDAVKPWTIKAIAVEARDRAIAAARRENLTTGQWLEKRIREWTEDGSPTAIAIRHPSGHHQQPAAQIDPASIAQAAIALAAAPDDPLIRTAKTTIRGLLIGMRQR